MSALLVARVSTVKAQNAAPFQLKIERFERRAVMPRDVAAGHDTQIAVILNCTGTPPIWWKKHNRNSSALWGDARLFTENSGELRPVPVGPSYKDEVQNWTPSWNPKIQRYEARYLLGLSDIARSKERIVLRGKISLSNFGNSPIKSGSPQNSTVAFSYGVRASGGVIAPPRVSRDPKLDVTRIEIEKLAQPQFDAFGNYKHDTIVRLTFRDRNTMAPQIEAGGYPTLMDEKGERIPLKYQWFPSGGAENMGQPKLSYYYRFLLAAIPKSQPNIFIEMQWSPHGDWPLHLRIPLRRNGRDLSGELGRLQYAATATESR